MDAITTTPGSHGECTCTPNDDDGDDDDDDDGDDGGDGGDGEGDDNDDDNNNGIDDDDDDDDGDDGGDGDGDDNDDNNNGIDDDANQKILLRAIKVHLENYTNPLIKNPELQQQQMTELCSCSSYCNSIQFASLLSYQQQIYRHQCRCTGSRQYLDSGVALLCDQFCKCNRSWGS